MATANKKSKKPDKRPGKKSCKDFLTHCTYCLRYLDTDIVSHPLWPNDKMCHQCAQNLERCNNCERKAVRWTIPKDENDVATIPLQVVYGTEHSLPCKEHQFVPKTPYKGEKGAIKNNMVTGNLTRVAGYPRPSYVCGKCNSVGIIDNKSSMKKEIIFILEFMFLELGIFFSDGMLALQRQGLGLKPQAIQRYPKDPPPKDDFESAADYENWLRKHTLLLVESLPLVLLDPEQAGRRAYTDCDFRKGNPYVKCIAIQTANSRPKFWQLVIHELVHVFVHLYSGTIPSDRLDIEESGCNDSLEEGVANTIAFIAMRNILEDISHVTGCRELASSNYHVVCNLPPHSLWDLKTPFFSKDFPHCPTSSLRNEIDARNISQFSNPDSLFYQPIHEEALVIGFLMRKFMANNDPSYGVKFRKCLKIVDNRTIKHGGALQYSISTVLHEFVTEGKIRNR